jgi:hypothetical protein
MSPLNYFFDNGLRTVRLLLELGMRRSLVVEGAG